MTRDIKSNVAEKPSIDPQAMNATVAGAGVDTRDNSSAMASIYLGAWTDGTHTFTVEDSDDNVTFLPIAAANLDGALPVVSDGTLDNTIVNIGIVNNRQFVNVTNTVATATTGLVADARIVMDHAHIKPVA